MYDGCNEYMYLPFCRLSMPTLTNILDLEYVCGTGNSIHHCSISHIIQKGIGVCFTVITSIVTGHKSVSVILWKLK